MPTPINIGTRDVPLKLAKNITEKALSSWESGEFLKEATPITQELLKYWFSEPFISLRLANFHEGQRRSILNTIYMHEVLGCQTVQQIYEKTNDALLLEIAASELQKPKYQIPKYAIKMATGTGKTWVMHALVIWQYLNATHEDERSGKYSKNFLLVAPGRIVYQRLIDAYVGKEIQAGERLFELSDFHINQDLFLPPAYRQEFFSFVQNNTVKREEISRKVTGDGQIMITNWHLFMRSSENEDSISASPLDDPSGVIKDIFPVMPGTSGGNELKALDNNFLGGGELEYITSLKDIVVINDEAHHIHENKTYREVEEVEWQKSLNTIANGKGSSFIQIDFSATPYDVTGSGNKRTKHFFPHIITDFDLVEAIRGGLVKTIAIDKRREIVDLPLDFAAIRDDKGKVIGLSEGQRLMLRTGLKKIAILEKHFNSIAPNKQKHPKMLVICEDTNVSPFVEEFCITEGLSAEDVIRIDSNREGEVPEKEWGVLKEKLFNIDKYEKPKVIISVLMLREGFDVNNICVIVPLRASEAPILLEQIIGRGLRLMWREPEFISVKDENRHKLLVEKKEPENYIDLLSIIEHPAFMEFYKDLMDNGLAGISTKDPKDKKGVSGDIEWSILKTNYKDYDIYWPVLISDEEQEIESVIPSLDKMASFTAFSLNQLLSLVGEKGEKFFSEELTVKTQFGEYTVDASLFNSESYNEYLQKILYVVTNRMDRIGQRKMKNFPVIQINQVEVIRFIDNYVKNKLFSMSFDPFEGNNWKVLLLKNGMVTEHIVKEIGKAVFEMLSTTTTKPAEIKKKYFSEIAEIPIRLSYSLELVKTIYERTPYPSNKGKFERDFLEFIDNDSKLEGFIKILEHRHLFSSISYIRKDGLLASYHPDFLIFTKGKAYVIETKADNMVNDENVRQKQLSTIRWVDKINSIEELSKERIWEYIILTDKHFYGLQKNNASLEEILNLAKISEAQVLGKLF